MVTDPRNPNVAKGILSREGAAWQQARGAGPAPVRPQSPPVDPSRFSAPQNAAKGILSKEGAAWQQDRMARPGAYTAPPAPPAPPAAGPTAAPAGPTAAPAPAKGAAYQAGKTLRNSTVGSNAPRAGAAGALAGLGIGSAAESLERPTEDYYRRLMMDPSSRSLGKDVLARSVGVMSDLGATILDAPVDLVNAGSKLFGGKGDFQLPGGGFRDILRAQDGASEPAGSSPSLRDPAFARGAQTLARTGAKQDPSVGGGRMNPTLSIQGAGPTDFNRTSDIQKHLDTNGPMPPSMTDGNIWKSKDRNGTTTYSGVGGGAGTIMDANTGMPTPNQGNVITANGPVTLSKYGYVIANKPDNTALIKAAQSGDYSGLSSLQQQQADILRSGGTFDSAGNLQRKETTDTLAREGLRQEQAAQAAQNRPQVQTIGSYGPDGKLDGYGLESYASRRNWEISGAARRQPGESGKDFRARMDGTLKGIESREKNSTDLRTNAATNETSRLNNSENNETQRRGQDMTAAERRAERDSRLRQQQAMGEIWQKSGGNARVAADMALSAGLDGSGFLNIGQTAQALDKTDRDEAFQSMAWAAETDENDKITDRGRALLTKQIESIVPGYSRMSAEERAAVQPLVNGGLKALRGMNQTRNTGWWPAILGGERSKPAMTALPKDLRAGGMAEDVGVGEGVWNNNVEIGDMAVRLNNGQTLRLPRGEVDTDVLDFFEAMGIKTGKREQ
jgi:hypothetical protein